MIQQFYPVSVKHPFQYELNKDMTIAAAHYIPDPGAGKCQQIHGHTYFVNVTIAGNHLDDAGFLVNFRDIKKALEGKFDHTVMNDHFPFAKNGDMLRRGHVAPSTENVAKVFFGIIADLCYASEAKPTVLQVIVRETPESYVTYRNPDFIA